MKELVVISGKGGTGKTSIAASFVALADNAVVADCDVDAADLHLVLNPVVKKEQEFQGTSIAIINKNQCLNCGECDLLCRFEAIDGAPYEYRIDPLKCEGCGVCAHFCPANAIRLEKKIAGSWFVSTTRHGPLIHARLGIAEDNSGKLVSRVREAARYIASLSNSRLIIIDGSPGIGCPVIASITGAQMVLIVTEPTLSGLHDLKRVLRLINHFRISSAVCINKYDLNSNITEEIGRYCHKESVRVIGKIPYCDDFTRAQMESLAVVELDGVEVTDMIREMWQHVSDILGQ